jgi:hypothetical protein
MKKFLIAGSSLAAVAAAGSAGAVDVTLGGSINMGVEFGLGKGANDLAFSDAFNEVSLSINAAHTTDGGLVFGGGFTMGTAASIEFAPYADAAGAKYLAKRTVDGRTNIAANLWNVSGGGAVASGNVVSVKINSSWMGIDAGQTEYTLALGAFTSSNVCKIAGRGAADQGIFTADPSGSEAGNATTSAGSALADMDAAAASDAYLPAGQLFYATAVEVSTSATVATTSMNATGASTADIVTTRGATAQITMTPPATAATVKWAAGATAAAVTRHYNAVSKGQVDIDGDGSADVTSAAIYAGPFMEVMMASSETKMVVGAACLEGNAASDTAFFMNNASDVMTVSNASIYIDGGFGKLTLQSGDYAGGVSSIAGAGDAADIDAGGLVVVAQGLGILGANPYLAVDLAAGDSLGSLEVITGGTIDLGGLSASIDVALDNPADVFGVSAWDLGATYALGDLGLAFATDSSSDWGLSASLGIAGFAVKTTFGSSTASDHTKSGITYTVGASTALNGFNLALGFDQDLEPTVGVSYDLGGLVLSAGYDAADQGGKLGAKLSF